MTQYEGLSNAPSSNIWKVLNEAPVKITESYEWTYVGAIKMLDLHRVLFDAIGADDQA